MDHDEMCERLLEILAGTDYPAGIGMADEFVPIFRALQDRDPLTPGQALTLYLRMLALRVSGGAKGLAEWGEIIAAVRSWCAPNPDLRAILILAIRTRQVPLKEADELADIERAARGELPFCWEISKHAREHLVDKGSPSQFMVDGTMARAYSQLHAFLKACDAPPAGRGSKGEADDRDFLAWWQKDEKGTWRLVEPAKKPATAAVAS